MGVSSLPKIHPASGVPFVNCRGVIEAMGLPISLDGFSRIKTSPGFLSLVWGSHLPVLGSRFPLSFPIFPPGQDLFLLIPWISFVVYL
jgi:hypothetical protein